MAFDMATAQPVPQKAGFDLSTARPVGDQQNPTFQGLPQETVDAIKAKYPDTPTKPEQSGVAKAFEGFGAGLTGGFDQEQATGKLRNRAANLERLRLENPYAADLVENMPGWQTVMIGAGKQVDDVGQGLGRLIGVLDAEDARDDPYYEALRNIRPGASGGELLGEGLMLAVPGGAAQKIARVAPRVAATAGVEGAAAGLNTAGEGGSAGEIARDTAIGATLGPVLGETARAVMTPSAKPSKTETIRNAINEGDKSAAGYRIDPSTQKVVKDPLQDAALKQGFADTAVIKIPKMTPETKKVARRILGKAENVLRRGYSEGALNPPAGEIGKSVMDGFNAVKRANREAGKDIRAAMNNMENTEVDVSSVVDQFTDDMEKLGVSYEYTKNGLKPEFKGSLLEGNSARQPMQWVFNKLKASDSAKNLHDVKKYLDQKINWNESPMNQKPMDREAVNALKAVRGGINDKLRATSGDYASANDRFRETVGAMESVMDVMGRRFDPDSDAVSGLVGQQLRKTLSNYGVGPDMVEAMKQLDATSAKYGAQFDDDVIQLADFYSELERRFGSFKPNSFQGVSEKAGDRVARRMVTGGASGGLTEIADQVAGKAIDTMRGVSEENAIKALRRLLAD